jgi:hypothetical protein
MQVKTIEHLKELARDGREFGILLNGGVFSSKYIRWGGRKFYIENYIDGSEQCLTAEELGEFTNIVEAIEAGALACEE